MPEKVKGLKGIIVNPAEVIDTVDTPINSDKNYFVSAFLFDKKKWKLNDAIKYVKGKIMVREPIKTSSAGKLYRIDVVKRKSKSETKSPINVERGVFALLGVDSNIDMEENPGPKKVTGEVARFILKHKEKTPKEINALLGAYFKGVGGRPLKLHPGTIYKIARRKYRVGAKVDSPVDNITRKCGNKEVTVNLNPLIAEITSNPTIPVYKTAWYKNSVRAMVKSGKTAYVIAQQLNKRLMKLPKHIWVRQAKARVGTGGTVGRERKEILTPKGVYRSILGSGKRRGIMPGVAKHKLLDPRMLRGRAAKLYQQTKSMPKVVAQLRTAFKKIKGKRTAPYTKPSTRAAMKKFPTITKRKSHWSKLSPKEKKAWAAKMQRAKRSKAKGKTKSKTKYSPKSKKRRVGANVGAKNIAGYDVLNSMDELDLATLPLEEFNDIAAMADAINPMIRMPNIQGLLTKLGNIALGKVPGAYALLGADWIAEKITFLLPPGPIKNIVTEFLADGAVYGIAEAFLPYRYATIQQSIQDVAVLKFLSNVRILGFDFIPKNLFGMRPLFGAEAVSQGHHYSDLESPHDEILAEVDESILGGEVERELTEEEVGQLLTLEQADPAQYPYAPQLNVHQTPQPEAVSSQDAHNQ